jgi:hypothetical protein
MTTRIGAAIAAGFLAIGILVGAAGTIVVRDATTPDHMGDMAGMASMMGDGGMAGMMSMTPGASVTPDEHGSHHETPSPETTR